MMMPSALAAPGIERKRDAASVTRATNFVFILSLLLLLPAKKPGLAALSLQ
jgi:hypothetical protein